MIFEFDTGNLFWAQSAWGIISNILPYAILIRLLAETLLRKRPSQDGCQVVTGNAWQHRIGALAPSGSVERLLRLTSNKTKFKQNNKIAPQSVTWDLVDENVTTNMQSAGVLSSPFIS